MSEIGNYYAQIGVRGLQSVEGAFGRVKKGLTGMASAAVAPINRLGNSLMRLVNPLTLVASAAGGAFAAFKFAQLASDAEEIGSKFDVVFRGVRGEAQKTAADLKRYMGASTSEVKQSLANLGDLFKPLGFAEDEALKLSATMTRLAADLSSFSNIGIDEALQRLQGTLIGSHENALKFGVVINENTLKAKMAELGTDKLTGAAFEQAKVYARLRLLMEGTSDAQGDLGRTSNSYANTMRRMHSTLKELGETLGKVLLPIFKGVGNIISAVAEKANHLVAGELPELQGILTTVQDVLNGIADAIRGTGFSGWSAQLSDAFTDAADILMTTLKAAGQFLLDIAIVVGAKIGEGIIDALPGKGLVDRFRQGVAARAADISTKGLGGLTWRPSREAWAEGGAAVEAAKRGDYGKMLGQSASDAFGENSELQSLFRELKQKYAKQPGSEKASSGPVRFELPELKKPAITPATISTVVPDLAKPAEQGPGRGPGSRGGYSFTGLAELANQMQTEVGRREQEAARNAAKAAEGIGKLAVAADGGALKVRVVGQPAAVFS